MHRLKLLFCPLVFAIVVSAMLLKSGGVEAASPLLSVPWKIVPSPNPGTSLNILRGVAATSQNDAWAVGNYPDFPFNQNIKTLIEFKDQ